jgi:hypothetical protein
LRVADIVRHAIGMTRNFARLYIDLALLQPKAKQSSGIYWNENIAYGIYCVIGNENK